MAMSIGDLFRTTLAQNMRNIEIPLSSSSSSLRSDQELTLEHCLRFRNDPTVNPLTGRTISTNGRIYEELQLRCNELENRYSKSKSSIRSTDSSLDETQLHTSCITLLSDTNNPTFHRFTNKLKKICHQHLEKCDQRRLNQIRSGLQYHVREQLTYDTEFTSISIVPDKPYWPQVMNDYLYGSSTSDFMMTLAENLVVKFVDQKGIGEGLTRTFIQGCLDNIMEHGFFIKTDELSNRYLLNPELTIDNLRRYGYQIDNESQILFIYEKIGTFFQYCMISGYPIGFYLSRSLLYKILKPKKTPTSDTLVLYYLLEMPSISSGIINLLRHPETIKDTGLEFNDDFPLVETDAPLSADNFRSYLQLRATHQFTQQLYPKSYNTHSRIESFVSGFQRFRRQLIRHEMTVPELDKFLCGKSITLKSFVEWYNDPSNLTYSITVLENPTPLKDWFETILRDNGETFPYAELGMERPSTKEARKTLFLEFIVKLLAFWSGLRTLQSGIRYQVTAIDNPVPKSSTCFYQLKLPKAVPSRDELYRRLVMAIYGVEQGIGSAGGKGKVLQRIRRSKYS